MPNGLDCWPGKVDESRDPQFGICPICGHATTLYWFFLALVRLDPLLSGFYYEVGGSQTGTALVCPPCGYSAAPGSGIGVTEDGWITKKGRVIDEKRLQSLI